MTPKLKEGGVLIRQGEILLLLQLYQFIRLLSSLLIILKLRLFGASRFVYCTFFTAKKVPKKLFAVTSKLKEGGVLIRQGELFQYFFFLNSKTTT